MLFANDGHVATVALSKIKRSLIEQQATAYMTIGLPEIFGKLRTTNPKPQIILHRNKASSHTSYQTNEYLGT